MATFLKKIHTTDEDELNLGKDLLKFLTETLELDLNSLHIMFKNIFNLPVVLVLNFRKTLKRSECEYVKQKHMTRNYEFERRLTRLKIIPKSSRVVFFVVKRSRSRFHPFETYEKMATIRLEDTYLRFLNSGKARHRLTTIPPSYVIEGRTMLPSREVDDAFSKRCHYKHEQVKSDRPACYEYTKFGKCTRLDRGLTCKFAHPKYMTDRDVIRPLVLVNKESGEVEYMERVKRRCARCTLPIERGGECTSLLDSDEDDDIDEAKEEDDDVDEAKQEDDNMNETKQEDLKSELCERCQKCTLPSRAFSMPRSYSTRPVAKFRDQCLNRGIRTGILNLTGHKKNRATK